MHISVMISFRRAFGRDKGPLNIFRDAPCSLGGLNKEWRVPKGANRQRAPVADVCLASICFAKRPVGALCSSARTARARAGLFRFPKMSSMENCFVSSQSSDRSVRGLTPNYDAVRPNATLSMPAKQLERGCKPLFVSTVCGWVPFLLTA